MLNIKKAEPKEANAYLYRCALEVMGRSLEFGFTYKDAVNLRKFGQSVLTRPQDIAKHFGVWRKKYSEKQAA